MRRLTQTVYKFDELDAKAQTRVISNHIDFLLENDTQFLKQGSPYHKALKKCEEMQTPWFLPQYLYEMCKTELIYEIRADDSDYFANGNCVPYSYYIGNDEKYVVLDKNTRAGYRNNTKYADLVTVTSSEFAEVLDKERAENLARRCGADVKVVEYEQALRDIIYETVDKMLQDIPNEFTDVMVRGNYMHNLGRTIKTCINKLNEEQSLDLPVQDISMEMDRE